jgi:hypothetical protein
MLYIKGRRVAHANPWTIPLPGALIEDGTVMRSRNVSFIFLASLTAAAPVAAQMNPICDDLRGRLADVSETIGTTHRARAGSNAIAQLSQDISKAVNDLRDRGCASDGGSIASANDAAACDQLGSAIDRMQEQMRYQMDQRAGQGGGSDKALRGELETELRDNGCDQPSSMGSDTTISNRTDEPATPDQQAMRTDTFFPPMDQASPHPPIAARGFPQNAYGRPAGRYGASVRTVCVRTCDGGFFPMTPDATAADFQRDADSCAKMCPGVQTELFFHYLQSQETTQMVSASTGAPYSTMPYAFAYKKRPPGEKSLCSCNMSAYYDEIKRENAIGEQSRQPTSGVIGAQPENSITNIPNGSITTIQTIKPLPPAPARQSTAKSEPAKQPEDRPYDPASKVRQVGPQFLSGDEGKIDLKHPAIPGAQPAQ